MARTLANAGLMPSLLDRLIDPESVGPGGLHGYTPRQMMDAVRRDLEELFNTHRSASRVPEGCVAVQHSIVAYGLPDLPSLAAAGAARAPELRRLVEEVVGRYEPRLRDVRVSVADAADTAERRVRINIEARLNVEPSPEVAFETVLELTTGQASIRTRET